MAAPSPPPTRRRPASTSAQRTPTASLPASHARSPSRSHPRLLLELVAGPRRSYSQDGIDLYHGRAEDVLPWLAGSDVELVLTSPPYNLSGDGGQPTGTYFRNLDGGYDHHGDALPHAAYVEWQHQILRGCWDTLAEAGAIFYNHKPIVRGNQVRLPLELVPPELPCRQVIVWDRGSGFNRQRTYFVPTYELILMLARPAFRLATRSIDDVWRIPFETGSAHPAPFPLSLARRAVEATSAGLVLDPFAGSGTTLRAAKDAGRRAIGIEMSEQYCQMAIDRLAQASLLGPAQLASPDQLTLGDLP